MAATLLAHAARELPGERPHRLAHLTKLGRRCREHVHVLEPARRDQPGARDTVGLVAQPSPHLLREHASVLLEPASEVVPQPAQLGRIAVARSCARLDHRGNEQVREVEGPQDSVEEVPLATVRRVHPRVTVDGIDREQSEGIDVRVAQCPQQLGAEVGVGDADTRRRAGDSRGRRTRPSAGSESAPRRSGKHSSKSDEKTARSSGRLISVACIAVRKASRSSRSTCRIADAASSTSPSETSTPPSLSAANRRSSIARMPSPAGVTACRASR